MIRNDEIRPLAQQQQKRNNDFSYTDLISYDVNNDETSKNLPFLICWCNIW